ncbi:hypothetical protein EBQ81_04485 [bacterium]|nr:hypothetical protein [bacterium]
MQISITILENSKQIQETMLRTLLPQVSSFMHKVITTIKKELPEIVQEVIFNSPEYTSILGGDLKYQFGLPDSASKLNGLINIWTNNINIEYVKPSISNGQIKSKFSASMIRADYSDVLGTDYAKMNDTQRGYSLPWLQWLLLDGNQILIEESVIVLGPNPNSRTGFAVMKPSRTGSWRVPSEFAGTIQDNWLTRAVNDASPKINNLLNRALTI